MNISDISSSAGAWQGQPWFNPWSYQWLSDQNPPLPLSDPAAAAVLKRYNGAAWVNAVLKREAVHDVLAGQQWQALWGDAGPLAQLFAAKRAVTLQLLRGVRGALDAVPGPRRRLELQAFPPPFHHISGFPLASLQGVADAVGIKLYTMHWPMIARFWAAGLVGAGAPALHDAATAALAMHFGSTDTLADGARPRYPEADEAHPVSLSRQREKLELARAVAGDVPIVGFCHSYGPLDDVVRRFGAVSGGRAWINRYGYLSEAKLAALGTTWRNAKR